MTGTTSMVSISAQPYNYELPEDGTVALLVIDMQRDFLEPGGFGEALVISAICARLFLR